MSAQHFYITTANPISQNDPGVVEEGWYVVKGGKVILTDAGGTPLGDHGREIERDFGRRIVYPKVGVA
jgi:hypothetical protein